MSGPAPITPPALNELQEHAQRQRQWQTMWQPPADSVATKGQIIVLTGNGIGKSNTAFGMGMAVLAQNRRLAVVQFLATHETSPARQFLGQHPLCEFTTFGDEPTWQAQHRTQDIDLTRRAWSFAKEKMRQSDLAMIILDDINPMLYHNYLAIDPVLLQLRQRNPALTVVLTGRHAPFELIDMADLCIEMRKTKLPDKSGAPRKA